MKQMIAICFVLILSSCRQKVNSYSSFTTLTSAFKATESKVERVNPRLILVTVHQPAIAANVDFTLNRITGAIAIMAGKTEVNQKVDSIYVNLLHSDTGITIGFSANQLSSWMQSADQAEAYVRAMLQNDEDILLELGDPHYMGESMLDNVHILAEGLEKTGAITALRLAGILNSTIDGTAQPVHIVSFLLEKKNGSQRIIHLFVRPDGNHQIAGINTE